MGIIDRSTSKPDPLLIIGFVIIRLEPELPRFEPVEEKTQ